MSLSDLQKEILTALDRLEREIKGSDDPRAIAELDEHGIPWSVTLLLGGSPTRSESASYCRSLKRLKEAGHVTLIRWEDNQMVSNVKLTDAGRKAQEETPAAEAKP